MPTLARDRWRPLANVIEKSNKIKKKYEEIYTAYTPDLHHQQPIK